MTRTSRGVTSGSRRGRALAGLMGILVGCGSSTPSTPASGMDGGEEDALPVSDAQDAQDVPARPGVQGARCDPASAGACVTGLRCERVTSDAPADGVCTRSCLPVASAPSCDTTGEPGGRYACVLSLTSSPAIRCVARCGANGGPCPSGTVCRGDSDRDGSPELCLPPATAVDAGGAPSDVPTAPAFAYLRGVSSVSNAVMRLCLGRDFVGDPMRTIAAGAESPSTGFVRIAVGAQRSSVEVQSTRANCLDISTSRTSWTARAGESYTVFGGEVAGIGPRLLSEQEPAPSGRVRIRASSRADGVWAMGVDVCTPEGAVALAGVGRTGTPTAAIDPPSGALVARMASTPPCTGAVVGSLPGQARADGVYTLFLVASDSDRAPLAVWCSDPTPAQNALEARCVHARLRP